MTGLFVENDDDPKDQFVRNAKSWAAVLVSLLVLIGGGWFVADKVSDAWNEYTAVEDYEGAGTDELIVTIPRGSSLGDIGVLLVQEDVIKSTKAWREAADKTTNANDIQAARYRMKKQLPAKTAMDMLLDPANIVRIRVTIPEGLRQTEQWPIIQKATGVSAKNLAAQAKDAEQLGLPDYANNKTEGFLFPETYEVSDEPTAKSVMAMQIRQFRRVSDGLKLEDAAKAINREPLDVVIVASIIEKEVSNPNDQPLVASVLYNRLDAGQRLELDSTVIYANNIKGKLTTTDEQRNVDSPYNTYRNKGLPPGPISNPGKAALAAALNPAKTDYRYFVVVDPEKGTTKFAKTFDEHNQNVREFQRWCQANKGKC